MVLKGRDLFDASLFRDPSSTALFYSFIAELKSSVDNAHPSATHRFIKTLDTKGKLVRSYTQNIDGFEEREGLLCSSSEEARSSIKGKGKAREVKNVQLHGDIHRVRCTVCSAEYPCSENYLAILREGSPPPCPECADRCESMTSFACRDRMTDLKFQLRPVSHDRHDPFVSDICVPPSFCTRSRIRLVTR